MTQENRRQQAELEGPARLELLDDRPGTEILFVRIGADQIEVELVGEGRGDKGAKVVETIPLSFFLSVPDHSQ